MTVLGLCNKSLREGHGPAVAPTDSVFTSELHPDHKITQPYPSLPDLTRDSTTPQHSPLGHVQPLNLPNNIHLPTRPAPPGQTAPTHYGGFIHNPGNREWVCGRCARLRKWDHCPTYQNRGMGCRDWRARGIRGRAWWERR